LRPYLPQYTPATTNHAVTAGRQRWPAWLKILFRFFFIFLSLQVFSDTFMGNWFGRTLLIWHLGEKIFVPPCLWLNDHIFHFKYKPESWTSFSGSLQTIRDVVYLFVSSMGCVVWTALDKKRADYNRLHYWFTQCLVTALACISFCYGIIKLFPVQMSAPNLALLQTPLGELRPFDLLWATFGYGRPYQAFSGFFEVVVAVLILFKRTRVIGLIIIVSVMLNVIMLNYTYQVGVLILSFYILLVALFLLAPYAGQLLRFFLTSEAVRLLPEEYLPVKNGKTRFFKATLLMLLACSFIANLLSAYNLFNRTESVNKTRQYSLIKNYIINSDTLHSIVNDTLRWRTWNERTIDGKRMLTITTMKPGQLKNYTVERDTAKQLLVLHPVSRQDTASLRFSYTDISSSHWRLDGMVKHQNIHLDLQKINPDTTEQLLKIKRYIIIVDDDQGF
jgi:hypothetical protein